MPILDACPRPNDYQRLIRGELPPSDVERISLHLENCSSCAAAVQTLLGQDTLLSVLRGASSDVVPVGEEVPADLTQRLLALAAQSPASTAELAARLAPPQRPDEMGRLAHYRVLKVLGQGGMGVVFLAEDTRLGRTVALKTMKPEIAADPRHRQRFLREARAAAKVEDDHIVPIYDVGEERGVPWLAMPLLKGQSLDELLRRVKVLKPAQAARLGAQVARGLAAAHAAGLIHRDVKPANIWVEPEGGGRAKLLDFGLARDDSPQREPGQEQLTRSGALVGTPAFMAPEQAQGRPLDARADLFGLGCVLYRMVTGRLPFRGQGMIGTLFALVTETPPAAHEVSPDVPRPLSALIMNLLAKDRSDRPQSAAAVAAALEAMQGKPAGPLPVARPVAFTAPRGTENNPWADLTESAEPPAPAAVPRRRWRQVAVAAALLLAVGGALAAGIVIIIRNKDGQEVVRVLVPEGGSVETRKDGDNGPRKGEPADSNADRRAAEWVLSIGGRVTIRQDGQERNVNAAKDLPGTPFEVAAVLLSSNPKVDDTGLAHLKGLTNLTSFNLSYTGVSGAGLVHLKGLTRLRSLDLGYSQVTDAALEHLKGLSNLTELYLSRTPVSDAGLAHLKGLSKLVQLHLYSTPVGDAGLAHLEGLTSLNHLNLENTQVSDAGLAHLKGLTNLTHLYLGGTRISDAGLGQLEGLTGLENLHLRGARIGDAGLEHLKGLTNLTNLSLSGTRATDAGLAHLKGLTKLTTLWVSNTRVSGAGLKHLANAPLRQLFLDYSRISAGEFARLRIDFPAAQVHGEPRPTLAEELVAEEATMLIRVGEGQDDRPVRRRADLPAEPFLVRRLDCTAVKKPVEELLGRLSWPREYEFERLETLDVSGCTFNRLVFAGPLESLRELNLSATSAADLQPLLGLKKLRKLSLDRTRVSNLGPIAELPELEELSLAEAPITNTAVKALERLPSLRKLDLRKTAVTGRGVGPLAKLPKLAELSLAGSKVSDESAAEVGGLTKLERLSLAGCTFGDAGLKHLAGLNNLTQLDVTDTQVTADGVAGLQNALPKCKIASGPVGK
jgi:serine/threonine protein kinase/Leucine-rich repeat (LRR) protein